MHLIWHKVFHNQIFYPKKIIRVVEKFHSAINKTA
ncbi:hypothetical protein LEP1GSC170_0716, partial [Leptospira interrogans serovar Bataviae str. HAI135]